MPRDSRSRNPDCVIRRERHEEGGLTTDRLTPCRRFVFEDGFSPVRSQGFSSGRILSKAACSGPVTRTRETVLPHLRIDFRFICAQAEEKVAKTGASGDQEELWQP